MNELMKEIDEAFKLLGGIPVAGDAVDIMAAVRDRLRRAYKLSGTKDDKLNKSEGEPNG